MNRENIFVMPILRYFRKIQFIDYLIRRRATGNQKLFAEKTNLSRSMLNQYLSEMKEMGFPIKYSKVSSTYYYEKDGKMVDSLFEAHLSKDEMNNQKGGLCCFNSPVCYVSADHSVHLY